MTARSTRRTYRAAFARRSPRTRCLCRRPGVGRTAGSTHTSEGAHDGQVRALRPGNAELGRAGDARPGGGAGVLRPACSAGRSTTTTWARLGHYYIGTIEGDDVAGVSGQMPGMEGHPAFWGVYLAVDDVDAATAKVEAAGGKVEAGPFDVNDNGRMSALQDPTGARVNLWQAKQTIGTRARQRAGHPDLERGHDARHPARHAVLRRRAGHELAGRSPMGDDTYTVLSNAEGRQIGGAMNPPMEGVPPALERLLQRRRRRRHGGEGARSSAARSWRPRSTCRAWAGWPCWPTPRARCST